MLIEFILMIKTRGNEEKKSKSRNLIKFFYFNYFFHKKSNDLMRISLRLQKFIFFSTKFHDIVADEVSACGLMCRSIHSSRK